MKEQMNLKTFEFGTNEVRVEVIEGEPWFCLKDLCDVLGLKSHDSSTVKPSNIRMRVADCVDGSRRLVKFVNEVGLYKLVSRARQVVADSFLDFLKREVFPLFYDLSSGKCFGDFSKQKKTNGYSSEDSIEPEYYCIERSLLTYLSYMPASTVGDIVRALANLVEPQKYKGANPYLYGLMYDQVTRLPFYTGEFD